MVASNTTDGSHRVSAWFIAKTVLTLVFAAVVLASLAWAYVTQPFVMSGGRSDTMPSADKLRLESHVRRLSEDFFPRDHTHPENLDECAAYIGGQLERAGGITSEQTYTAGGITYRNVIAHFGPDTKELVIVGAHYDAAAELPAADDNASGVAGLLELARLLGSEELAVGVDLIAYSTEEPPYFRTERMGSAVHAKSLKRSGAHVLGMMSLEMIGYFSEAEGSQTYPAPILDVFYPSKGDYISVVGRLGEGSFVRRIKRSMRTSEDLSVYSINVPQENLAASKSDHTNYWREGWPAVMISDTVSYRNPNYHTAQDTADTLDYAKMAKVVDGAAAAVVDLAR